MGQLPQYIDPWRMAAEQGEIDGELSQSALPRLAAIVEYPQGMVKLRLQATQDSASRIILHGELSTNVVLRCQRCLQPMTVALQSEFTLAAVRSEHALEQLPKELDALVLEHDDIALEQFVEDELLLVLPVFPKHAEGDCRLAWENAPNQPSDSGVKPFADLSKLLAKRES